MKWYLILIFIEKRVTPLTLTKMVQWPILNNSHVYPFCKTTPVTQLFSIGHCTIFCQCNSLKMVAKLFSQWKSGCTFSLVRNCTNINVNLCSPQVSVLPQVSVQLCVRSMQHLLPHLCLPQLLFLLHLFSQMASSALLVISTQGISLSIAPQRQRTWQRWIIITNFRILFFLSAANGRST